MALRRALVLCALVALVAAAPAGASHLIDRGATDITLKVNGKGEALVEYRVHGRRRHVLLWGAADALLPNKIRPQVVFDIDYSGGLKKYGKVVYPAFKSRCRPYDGPGLVWLVTACKAPDGSYWALQAWKQELPNFGFAPWLPNQGLARLKLSHWRGPLAEIHAYSDWAYHGKLHEVFGQLTYKGSPVYGYRSTSHGVMLDRYGRNISLDTFDSAYGPGWRRENAFLSRNPGGNFCYRFNVHDVTTGGNTHPPGQTAPRPKGNGTRYRLTVTGPGVTPDVSWEGKGLPDYDPKNPELVALEKRMNLLVDELSKHDRACHQH